MEKTLPVCLTTGLFTTLPSADFLMLFYDECWRGLAVGEKNWAMKVQSSAVVNSWIDQYNALTPEIRKEALVRVLRPADEYSYRKVT